MTQMLFKELVNFYLPGGKAVSEERDRMKNPSPSKENGREWLSRERCSAVEKNQL